ncbi:MAG: hypothetical protein AB1405_18165, partial [Bdellovibrionota bacterium]
MATSDPPFLPSAPRREAAAWLLSALVSLAGLAFIGLFGIFPDNDSLYRLARTMAHPAWMPLTGTKPLEMGLAYLVVWLPGDPRMPWCALGAVQLGLVSLLAWRLAYQLTKDRRWALAAALLSAANPLLLRHFLVGNSVAATTASLLWWCERQMEGDRRLARVALGLLALSRPDAAVAAAFLAALEWWAAPAPGRRPVWAWNGALLGACAFCWLFVDRVANGRWLGLLAFNAYHLAGGGWESHGVLYMLNWLRAAWITLTSEAVLLLALVGLLAEAGSGGLRRRWPLAGAIVVMHF